MLAGLRVLDLAGDALAYAGRVLADLGADVVLVEKPGGDERRSHPPAGATPDGRMVSGQAIADAGQGGTRGPGDPGGAARPCRRAAVHR
jgi:crotonobetainyl-CoA:carnitine CoA-transferase CaiB-like acyl-CoA transferase